MKRDEWATAASIGQVFSALLGTTSNAVGNFRTFAYPNLIRSYWYSVSWLLIIGGGATIVYLPFYALDAGRAAFIKEKNRAEEEKAAYYKKVQEVANLLNAYEYLEGAPIDEKRLLAFKQAYRPEIKEVFFSDNAALRGLRGAPSIDFQDEIGQGMRRIKIDGKQGVLVQIDSDPKLKRWIGCVFDDNLLFYPKDPTIQNLLLAIAIDIILLFLTVSMLLVVRLGCESAVMFYRYVDEVVAIHQTLKKSQGEE